ncbi:Fe2+-dependent dioxygenase [Brevundimonas fluminis]|jgi:PKHD-type hydroxylase|uniref:Fe2+-dependent dioxygenase n=1 Tax=Brevundimonas fluminis TaxID=2487274 RepID=UPI000F657110|nr:Fe2+-dependent dioxygenase [Brevundimonas fluminis]
MRLIAGGVLDAGTLAWARAQIDALSWLDGAATAGAAARGVKRNEQADLSTRAGQGLEALLRERILTHPVVSVAARPRTLSRLLVSRTDVGGGYGDHVDNALMGPEGARLRSDLSFTLFLSEPETYEGGGLTIEDALEDRTVRLNAGDMILYPSGAPHRVEPVTQGTRLVCVGWIQSHVRDAAAREVLWDLERVRAAWPDDADPTARLTLDKAIGALLRRWAET